MEKQLVKFYVDSMVHIFRFSASNSVSPVSSLQKKIQPFCTKFTNNFEFGSNFFILKGRKLYDNAHFTPSALLLPNRPKIQVKVLKEKTDYANFTPSAILLPKRPKMKVKVLGEEKNNQIKLTA